MRQVRHEIRIVNLRVGEWNPNDTGAGRGERVVRAICRKIFDRPCERGKSSYSKRSSGNLGRIRGKKHVGRHHIRRNVARHRDIYSYLGIDIKFHWLGGYLLHPRNITVDLVRRFLYIFRRLSGKAKVYNGAGKIVHRELVRPSYAWLREDEDPMEKYIYIGTIFGSDRYEYLGQLLLVFLAHPTATLHEQDIAIRYQIGECRMRIITYVISSCIMSCNYVPRISSYVKSERYYRTILWIK